MATSHEQPIGFRGLDAFVTHIEPALGEADRLSQLEPEAPDPVYEEPAAAPVHRDWGALAGLGRGLASFAGIGITIIVVVAIKACANAAFSGGGSSSTDYSASASQQEYGSGTEYSSAPTDSSDTTQEGSSADSEADLGDSSSNPATADSAAESSGSAGDYASAESAPSSAELGGRYDTAQIRYCLFEEARISGAQDYMNELKVTDPSEFNLRLSRFNNMVSDWNSRCSSFSYASGAMASIQNAVELQRQTLESEGRGRLQ